MTTPNTPAKKVVAVEILHLDETGYGYEGKHTRREWRAECLENFEAGAAAFLAWQESWQDLAKKNNFLANFNERRISNDEIEEPTRGKLMPIYCLDFSGNTFTLDVKALNYTFLNHALFDNSTFIGSVDFGETTFAKGVSFNETIFTNVANFGEATFTSSANFCEATFTSIVGFSGSTFTGIASFRKTIFTHLTFFGNVTFTGDADFGEATFTLNANFFEAIFIGNANFSAGNFKETANFIKAKFGNKSLFQSVVFEDTADFENAEFTNVGHFEGAKFTGENSKIPSFRGVDVGSTLLEFSDDAHFTQADFNEEAIKNIAFLKHLSEQHGQIDQALNFNAMELRAKYLQVVEPLRAKDLHLLERLFKRYFSGAWWALRPTWLYGLLSDFGRSYMRPLLAYVAIFVFTLGLGIYFATEHKPQYCQYTHAMLSLECDGSPPPKKPNEPTTSKEDEKLPLSGWRAALEYANYHATGVVDFTGDSKLKEAITLRLFGGSVKPWRARQFGTLLSIINTALLFLIALGLRNSYRLK
ncbi:MAG: pentapeptide repeat-containing protein [Gallionella sp.]